MDTNILDKSVNVTVINRDGEDAGTAVFTEIDGGVKLEVNFHGLPQGEFAMHVHEVGLATAPDFTDAGSHFNPTGAQHGKHSENGPHIGDLPNIVVPETGEFEGAFVIDNTSLTEGEPNTLNNPNGTTLIVHVGADDYISQPTGDAGDRQLAGVIFAKQEEE